MTKSDLAWMNHFNKLKSIFLSQGNCDVKKSECHKTFYWWICKQKRDKKNGLLRPDREQLLNSINFSFNESWEDMFEIFKDYFSKHKTTTIKEDDIQFYKAMHPWISKQLELIKSNKLPTDKINKFIDLGINIDSVSNASKFETNINKLKEFYSEKKHCIIPNTTEYKQLYRFTQSLRKKFKEGHLSEDIIDELLNMDFCFEPYKKQWNDMYTKAKSYHNLYGNLNVPNGTKQHKKLYNWIVSTRQKFKDDKLSSEQIEKLSRIEFPFHIDKIEKTWLNKYYKAEKFFYKNKHCSLYPTECSFELFEWALEQCEHFKNNQLNNRKLNYLKKINFDFNLTPLSKENIIWIEYFKKANGFFNRNGYYIISPIELPSELFEWSIKQCEEYKNGLLESFKIKALKNIKFDFNTEPLSKTEKQWSRYYIKLKRFFRTNGHCIISSADCPYTMYQWAKEQYFKKSNGLLSDREAILLDKVNFQVI